MTTGFRRTGRSRPYLWFLALYLYYYAYRYALKYNSSLTSPTYSDTPLAFQLFKYALLAGLLVWLFLACGGRFRVARRNRGIAALMALFIGQFAVLGALSGNTDAVSIALLFLPGLFYLRSADAPDLKDVERVMLAFWRFSALYELVQLALYFGFRRYPALAYPTGRLMDVRFGGAWDDPNGYALLMSFYLFYFLFRYRGWKQIFHFGATLLMLALTWSGTGLIAFAGAAAVLLLLRWYDRVLLKRYAFYACLGLVALLAAFAMKHRQIAESLTYFMQAKQGSVTAHLRSWDISWLRPMTLLGVSPNYQTSEVGYIRLLSIGGLPGLMLFVCIGLHGCARMARLLKRADGRERPFLYGALAYLVAFMLYQFNLPLIDSFSCMGVFAHLVILSNCAHAGPLGARIVGKR